MVGEFPELQGLMGRYYAEAQGEDEAVAHAIEDHYKPQGPNDLVPADPVSVAVALADKLDLLVGFWAIGDKPTGSRDPFALRRAALGVIRIILSNAIRLKLVSFWLDALKSSYQIVTVTPDYKGPTGLGGLSVSQHIAQQREQVAAELKDFFNERLRVQLREQGARHDLVDAVFALENQDDLVLIVRRVEALAKFLDTDDGKNLLAGYKRAVNIIRIEEKKDNASYTGTPDPQRFSQAEERALAEGIESAKQEASAAVTREDFGGAMAAIAKLRPAVDAFFDKVTVNVDEPAVRTNRLKLLNQIREATLAVADFSRIEG